MTQLDASSTQPDPVPLSGTGRSGAGIPIEALQDVELKVEVVLGRARLALRELLEVHPGSTIELDRSRNSPVDVLVNGTLFARGEIVVIDDSELGVQIEEVVAGDGAAQ